MAPSFHPDCSVRAADTDDEPTSALASLKNITALQNLSCQVHTCVFTNHKATDICSRHRDLHELFDIYEEVKESAVYNFKGVNRKLLHKLNVDRWESYSSLIKDEDVISHIKCGFPVDYQAPTIPVPASSNHASALWFPDAIDEYIRTEVAEGALFGPFKVPPFQWVALSPLMTREKRGKDTRRVIMDLSFPKGASVNSGVDKETYLGKKFKLRLPSPLTLKDIIAQEGEVFMWSIDIRRAYRQLRSDVLDLPLLCFQWKNQFFMDSAVPFGLRHGARNMQAVTQAFTDILRAESILSLSYIDDIIGVARSEAKACED